MKAIVVGGGIGGLATAAALYQTGWDVEVVEQAAKFTEVGAGLSVWPNALRALDALGLGQAVRDRALLETQAVLDWTEPKLQPPAWGWGRGPRLA